MVIVFNGYRIVAENIQQGDLHLSRLGTSRIDYESPEDAFAGDVAFAKEGGKLWIDGEVCGGVHAIVFSK